MSMDNLELWNRHLKPHKDAMRKAPKGLTAIDPMWTIREATQEWGPMGGNWGVRVLKEEIIKSELSGTQVHTIMIELYYPGGTIQAYGGTTMDGLNKSGPFFNDDYAKMSLTDATSKALSWLGFGAAVHMGMFDDNKYIDFRPVEQATKGESAPPAEVKEPTDSGKDPIPTSHGDEVLSSLELPQLAEIAADLANVGCDTLGTENYVEWHNKAIKHITGEEKLNDITNKVALINFIVAQKLYTKGKE